MDGDLEYSTKGTKGQTSETLTFFPKKDFHDEENAVSSRTRAGKTLLNPIKEENRKIVDEKVFDVINSMVAIFFVFMVYHMLSKFLYE